jgi:ABC-type nitrate/sulfonate/bicarbonate transport system ATPase subunit
MEHLKLSVEGIRKAYRVGPRIVQALDNMSIQVHEGEFVTIIGPSGCGKSTLFSIIAGLQDADEGVLRFDGLEAAGGVGRCAYMFQKDLLLPWRRLLDNVVLAQEIAGVPREQSYGEAQSLLPLFGLEGFEKSYPNELSGGMRQRAALLRTFLAHRELMLLDEPFGALDALTRAELQAWLEEVWERFRQTILFVTHDVEEAVYLSDRVYVMSPRPGRIVDEVVIPLPRPRVRSMVATTEFVRLREQLLASLTTTRT